MMRRPFTNLTLDERRALARMLHAKVPKTKIAERLGRDRSTITREVKRNWWHDKDVPRAMATGRDGSVSGRRQTLPPAQA